MTTYAQDDAAGGWFRDLLTTGVSGWLDYKTAMAAADARLTSPNPASNADVTPQPVPDGAYDWQRLQLNAGQAMPFIVAGVGLIAVAVLLKKVL